MKKTLAFVGAVVVLLGLTAGMVLADQEVADTVVPASSAGGMVNPQLSWSAQPGIYSSPVRLRYISNVTNNVAGPPMGSIWASSPFTLEIRDDFSAKLIALAKATTVTVNYRPADLGGRSESTLRLARYYDRWVDLPSRVDTVNHTVTADITVSGDYGLLASDAAPAPAPAAPAPTAAPAPPAPTAVPVPAAPTAAPAPAAAAPAPASTPGSSGITGRIYYDRDGNGIIDDGDFPVGGAGVRITSGAWSASTRTGPDGNYVFWGLGQGDYTVEVVVGPEWAFTTPASVAGVSVTGQAGSVRITDFGMWLKLP